MFLCWLYILERKSDQDHKTEPKALLLSVLSSIFLLCISIFHNSHFKEGDIYKIIYTNNIILLW